MATQRKRRASLRKRQRAGGAVYSAVYRVSGPDGRLTVQREIVLATELREAKRKLRELIEALEQGRDPFPSSSDTRGRGVESLTVAEFVAQWQKTREQKKKRTAHDSGARLRHHVLSELGDELLVVDVSLEDVEAVLATLEAKAEAGTLSRNTVHNVWTDFVKLLDDAAHLLARRGIGWQSPAKLIPPDDRPMRVLNPGAPYSRDTAESLLSEGTVPEWRRVLWALFLYTGARHDEVAALRWGDRDEGAPLLPRVTISKQVGGRPLKEDRRGVGKFRTVPEHPELSRILAAWRRTWAEYYGRSPTAEDLIVPRPTDVRVPLAKRSTLKQLRRDLESIGGRVGKVHELRATFLTLCCEDSPQLEHVIKQITHSRKGDTADVHYIASRWRAKCEAISRFDLRPGRGLRGAAADGEAAPSEALGGGGRHVPLGALEDAPFGDGAGLGARQIVGRQEVAKPASLDALSDDSTRRTLTRTLTPQKTDAKKPLFPGAFSGADGTRTRGLRRDRPAV